MVDCFIFSKWNRIYLFFQMQTIYALAETFLSVATCTFAGELMPPLPLVAEAGQLFLKSFHFVRWSFKIWHFFLRLCAPLALFCSKRIWYVFGIQDRGDNCPVSSKLDWVVSQLHVNLYHQ